jgi:transcriptional regulator with PAS, ATPase and Fis domain
MDTVEKISQSADTPVLIHGETGTGKELIARIIHHRSPNSSHPLVTMNCATIPNELIESEMFGYVKGAFSGADEAGKTGLVEEANGGTLFLDEVGDLSAQAQSKLLRFLESGEYYRVGGTEKRSVKTRIISATNRNIESMIEAGAFRRDLFFRLAVVKLEVPSLNRRKRDILPIATYFLTQFSEKLKKNVTGFTKNAEKLLLGHHWKGNIRELRNLIERAVLVAEGSQISIKDLDLKEIIDCNLPPDGLELDVNLPPLSPEGIDFQRFMQYIEKYYFSYALKLSGGNETKAAQLLGLTRDAFRYRRKKMNLEEKE